MDSSPPGPWSPAVVAAVVFAVAGATAGFLVGQALAPEPSDPADPSEDPLTGRGWSYIGIKLVAGPGRGALPLLPLDTDQQGRLVGEPTVTTRIEGGNVENATLDVRPWFEYCGRTDAPGLSRNWTGDNLLRYVDLTRDDADTEVWYEDRIGEPVRVEEVPVGEPFYATWRTPADTPGNERLTFGLLRWNTTDTPSFPWGLPFDQEGIMAWSVPSTHYCTWTKTQPVRGSSLFNQTEAEGRFFPWLEGIPHLVRDVVSFSAWDPSQVVEDERTSVGFPKAGGGTTQIPPLN